jgi:hypothetical protein
VESAAVLVSGSSSGYLSGLDFRKENVIRAVRLRSNTRTATLADFAVQSDLIGNSHFKEVWVCTPAHLPNQKHLNAESKHPMSLLAWRLHG